MNANEIIELTFNSLYSEYKTLNLTKEQVSEVLNISQATLNRRLKDSEALPEHTVFGGRYLFPIHEVAAYEAAMLEVA
ncbi:MAG: hypothetical protein WBF48_04975 [Halarcobacter sp.]